MTQIRPTLGDHLQFRNGRAPSSRSDGGRFPIYGSNGFIGRSDSENAHAGAIVVGRVGSFCGSVHFSKGPCWVTDNAIVANPKTEDSPRFWYYALKHLDLNRHSQGSGQALLNQTVLSNISFTPPGTQARAAIAEVLGALDDKIAANRRVVELADELVSATVGSNLREEVPLWEAVQVAFGEPFAGAHFSEEGNGRPLIRIRDLKSQACAVWTTEARPNEIVVNPGEVLVGMDAEFTATRWSGPSGLLNQRVLLAGSDQLGKPIVRESLKAPLARLERSKSGTTVIHLNKADLLRESVLIPAAEDLAPLRAIVDPVWDRAVAAERENQVLASTRDELLPLLMSGRITVGAASSHVEEVV